MCHGSRCRPEKIGRDAGEYYGFPKAGVSVTNGIDVALKLEADVVMGFCPTEFGKDGTFMPSAIGMAKALDAGKNVVTTIPVYHCKDSRPSTNS